LRLLIVGVAVLLLAAVGVWLTFQHIPAWYRPIQVPAVYHQRVRDDLTTTLNTLSSKMVAGEPFDHTFTQDQLNRWLGARMAIWPGVSRWVPQWLDEPMIGFRDDRIVIAGLVERATVRTIASLHLTLTADDDGLRVTVHRAQAGSLPMPLEPWREDIATALDHAQTGREPTRRITADHLFGLAELPNRFVWFNGKVPFRITEITTETDRIRMHFVPEPNQRR